MSRQDALDRLSAHFLRGFPRSCHAHLLLLLEDVIRVGSRTSRKSRLCSAQFHIPVFIALPSVLVHSFRLPVLPVHASELEHMFNRTRTPLANQAALYLLPTDDHYASRIRALSLSRRRYYCSCSELAKNADSVDLQFGFWRLWCEAFYRHHSPYASSNPSLATSSFH